MELSQLQGIGKVRLQALKKAGITCVRDLLLVLPVSYRDTTNPVSLAALQTGQSVCVEGFIKDTPRVHYIKKLSVVRATLTDGSRSVPLTWFNQPWMAKLLQKDEHVLLYGKTQTYQGKLTLLNAERIQSKTILPRYPAIENVPNKTFASLVAQAAGEIDSLFSETLPAWLLSRHQLMGYQEAVREAHFPSGKERLNAAKRRIGFENLLLYQLAMRLMRGEQKTGYRVEASKPEKKTFFRGLPFQLTAAQQNVLEDILHDLGSGRAMNRLVQGDVGSGKTAVAFGAMYHMARQGYQSALMAPTEVLARQHLLSARKILEPMGISCGLLVGGMKTKERREALTAIETGQWQVVIGTHALISEGVAYSKLGLVVTDEQHRFGVRQRKMLSDKSDGGISPHVLVMSATPIPRTLALILYGDLDVSIINQLPPGRSPVQTRIVQESKRNDLYGYMKDAVKRGEQAFLVCPLVEESEVSEGKSATQMHAELQRGAFNGLRLGLTYGTQNPQEKEETLLRFSRGEMDILVATTVIEVGIDVPNATIMVIENADRFGLSQLHQLRGRVGRGTRQSWCFLMGEPNERLKTMCDTNDGFVIAQKDLDLRGPGEFLGTRQHGRIAPEAYGVTDLMLIEETRECADRLLKDKSLEEDKEHLTALAFVTYKKALDNAAMN